MMQRRGLAMFTENHRRYLVTRLLHLDESISAALAKLEPQDAGALAPRYVADASAAQRQVLRDYQAQLRFVMRRFLQQYELPQTRVPVSALKALGVALTFAQITVEELRPSYLAGYGTLDAPSVEAANRLTADLQALLARMSAYLTRGAGGGLATRLAQLDDSGDEGALLHELDRIVSDHGLVELRAPLQMLIERAAEPRLEIAVFGRVSAGKSSLLNWWLGQEVLPTGVTPVTAVPTVITHADTARLLVSTATVRAKALPLEDLVRYATEEGNPGNREGVLELVIQLPAERLEAGIRLVDTPGLASLASRGASQTLEYLPRCDLGILLIEAGGAVTREDLDVARALIDSGSELIVALSKVDRLASAELAQALDYATRQLSERLGVPLEVGAISTAGAEAHRVQDWFEHVLAPRVAHAREYQAASMRRKVNSLRETVIAVLETQLAAVSRDPSESATGTLSEAGEAFAAARGRIRETREQWQEVVARVPSCVGDVLDTVAKALVACWHDNVVEASQTQQRVEQAIAQLGTQIADVVTERLGALPACLEQLLADSSLPNAAAEVLRPRGRPVFDASFLAGLRDLEPPRARVLLAPVLHKLTRARVAHSLQAVSARQLMLYSQALRLWGLEYLQTLADQFDALVAPVESAERARLERNLPDERARRVQSDVKLLREWRSRGAVVKPSAAPI
ncbi:MAG TPA: dynamin family protein [Steroidobacteraceae bacterium]|nr:dynamin family protein [Steroidobacteraceae bacterium]